ncbi:MAG: 2OG-Fe(II) oxygenase family protein [Gammaproteobacteria bacterium]|nr:2OG-Fe(II) oxygenase family protein [Gammaproteobacteria bacterium]
MSSSDYEIQALFAEAIFRADIGHAISDEQVEFIHNQKMVTNQVNLISENLYLFEEPEMASIREAIQETLDTYAREVMGISQQLYVTQSWSLINEQDVGMHGHSHSNSIVSGSLYYCGLAEPVAKMVFDRHKTYQQIELVPDNDKMNIYNAPHNVITPRKNEVLLFPSGLQHFVEPNQSPVPRHSIAFNTFVRGTLGNKRDVSELHLK